MPHAPARPKHGPVTPLHKDIALAFARLVQLMQPTKPDAQIWQPRC
jgi:hypothetical protein